MLPPMLWGLGARPSVARHDARKRRPWWRGGRNLGFSHCQSWASPLCHRSRGLRSFAIMKRVQPATMPFLLFPIHFIFFHTFFDVNFHYYPCPIDPISRTSRAHLAPVPPLSFSPLFLSSWLTAGGALPAHDVGSGRAVLSLRTVPAASGRRSLHKLDAAPLVLPGKFTTHSRSCCGPQTLT